MSSSASVDSSSSSSSGPTGSSIQVVVRLRPMNEKEKKHGTLPVVTASTQDKTVTVIKGQGARQVRSSFNFDNVFTAFSTQEEVFDATLKPVITDVMKGFESTVFAYGQTGTGKTHTMEGDLNNPEQQGVIPRSAQAIFESLKHPQYKDGHTVTCSYLEIYNEELCDLLADSEESHRSDKKGGTKLEIMVGKNGTFCRGLVEKMVTSAEDVLELMSKAQQQRKIGETKMNKQSSRSHCIFTMRVKATATISNSNGMMEFNGKLHMVDLAGSECAKTANLDKSSGADVARERERMNINRSLLTLGRVISMLKEMSENKKSHNIRIPYRDSKLTRILQESLGGRCKTVIVATLSPSITAIEESISTLNYAQSANGIINKPVSSSYLSVAPGGNFSKAPSNAGDGSSGDMTGSTIEHWHEMECRLQYMQTQVEEAQAALARKHMQQQEFVERCEKAETEKLDLETKLYEANGEINTLKEECKQEANKRRDVEFKLDKTEISLERTHAILKVTKETEARLTSEAKLIIETLDKAVADGDALHKVLKENHVAEVSRRTATHEFHAASHTVLDGTLASIHELSEICHEHLAHLSSSANDVHEEGKRSISAALSILSIITEHVKTMSTSMKTQVSDDGGMISSTVVMTSKITKCVEEIDSKIAAGEVNLSRSCNSALDQLAKCASHTKDLRVAYGAKSEQTLLLMEANIIESKNTISSMISTLSEAISAAETTRAAVRTVHKDLLLEWKTSSIEASKSVASISQEQNKIVDETLATFNAEMHHHDDMEDTLDTQRAYLLKDGQEHVSKISQQDTHLLSQENTLKQGHERQKELQANCIRNIMNGVQELVNKQMEELATVADEQFVFLKTNHEHIKEANSGIDSSAKNIVNFINSANVKLAEHVKAARNNDENVVKLLDTTKSTFSSISQSSNSSEITTAMFATKAEEGIQELSNLDTANEESLRDLKSKGEMCSLHITDSVLQETKNDIANLSSTCEEIVDFTSKSILSPCSTTFAEILKPRNAIIEYVKKEAKEIHTVICEGKSELDTIAKKHNDLADTGVQEIVDKENSFNKTTAPNHLASVSSIKDKLLNTVDALSATEGKHLHANTSQAETMKKHIKSFTTDTLKMEDEVEPVPTRTKFTYSNKLTSTPSDEEIIKNSSILCAREVERDGDKLYHNELAMEKENFDNGITTVMESSDSVSVKSAGSTFSSPESPALRDRSTNNDRTITKSTSSKRSKPLTAKKVRKTANTPSGRKKARLATHPPRLNSTPTRILGRALRQAKK